MSVSDELPPSIVPVVVSAVRWEEASNGFVPSGAVCGGTTFDGEPVYIGRTRLRENRSELTPGVLIPSEGHLILSYGTGVRTSQEYEVLVTSDPRSVHWVPCSAGQVPTNAVIGGIDCSYLEPLYIGKTRGNLSLGRTWRGLRFPTYLHQSAEDLSGPGTVTCLYDASNAADDCPTKRGKTEQHCVNESESINVPVSFPGKVHRTHKCLYIPFNEKEYLFRDYEVLTLTATPASLGVICKCLLRDRLLATINDIKDVGPELLQSNATLLDNAGDDVETMLTQKIDALPLPSKLKEFCKQGME